MALAAGSWRYTIARAALLPSSISPTDGAVGVDVSAPLVLEFDASVQFGTSCGYSDSAAELWQGAAPQMPIGEWMTTMNGGLDNCFVHVVEKACAMLRQQFVASRELFAFMSRVSPSTTQLCDAILCSPRCLAIALCVRPLVPWSPNCVHPQRAHEPKAPPAVAAPPVIAA